MMFRGLLSFQNVCQSHVVHLQKYSQTYRLLYRRSFSTTIEDDEQEVLDKDTLSLLSQPDEEYDRLVPSFIRPLPLMGHNVFVIQPKEKYGKKKTEILSRTTPELQLEEAIALVHSLEEWNVVASEIMSIRSQKAIFGTGQQEDIRAKIAGHNNQSDAPTITSLFISQDIMMGWQQKLLEEALKIPVFDRYSLVLQIFRQRAATAEAKLQLSLAELYYVRTRLREAANQKLENVPVVSSIPLQFGSRNLSFHEQKEVIRQREKRLKDAINRLQEKRALLRARRVKNRIPTVAIVGYTNSGKTSLIQALTKDKRLVPRDELFATLDVKVFNGRLENIHRVLFVDTIGFIADIPIALLESFKSVLEEITQADLVIHVQDMSHPDIKNQRLTVHKTLNSLGLSHSLKSTIIEIGNKVDKIPHVTGNHREGIDLMVSATKELYLNQLKEEIEFRLFINLGCFHKKLRVLTGSPEYQWLIRNAFIIDQTIDTTDENYTILTTRLTESVGGKFRKQFPSHPFFTEEGSDHDSGISISSQQK